MRKFCVFLFSVFLIFTFTDRVFASGDYTIESFDSQISINQDTSLSVTETIIVNFEIPKHGIFRNIPVNYSASGKTIRTNFDLISVTDENNVGLIYDTSRLSQSIKIKIGDPDKTITGRNIYVIKYSIDKVLQRFDSYDELYWNVTGSEWDTVIESATANVSSSFADITKVECFSGTAGSREQNCEMNFSSNSAQFTSTNSLGEGKDFTIVVALSKKSQLTFPGLVEKTTSFILDNWGYPVALFPLLTIFVFWFKKGRDRRFLSEGIYYQPTDKKTKIVSPFERKFLPLVYSPIRGITPGEVGTIIDEKVDIQDVVSEIVELARLKFIKIEKIKTKGIIREKTDYIFTRLQGSAAKLKSYQKYLLDKLFDEEHAKAVMLTDLKNHFYKHLSEFKKKLYENLSNEKIFAGDPDKVRIKWIIIFIVLMVVTGQLAFVFSFSTYNFGPVILEGLSAIPGFLLARSMPRRTAWGYSLFRQITGLRFFLKKGTW